MNRSPAPMCARASTTKSTASTSENDESTVLCIRSVIVSRGRWKPGRSTRTSWKSSPFAIPKMRLRVVCGLSETIATLPPARALTIVDLPTLGRPARATNPLFTPACSHPGAGSGTSARQLPRLGEQVDRRKGDELARVPGERDLVEAELDQPLAAPAARRRGDPDRLQVARPAALRDRAHDRRLLGADAERVRRVLDVDALEHASVARPHRRADVVLRVGRVGPFGRGHRPIVEVAAHEKSWKRARAMSAPSRPP